MPPYDLVFQQRSWSVAISENSFFSGTRGTRGVAARDSARYWYRRLLEIEMRERQSDVQFEGLSLPGQRALAKRCKMIPETS